MLLQAFYSIRSERQLMERLVILSFSEADELTVFSECRTLQAAAIAVAEVAGAAGMGAIGEIARGIYAMVDSLNTTGSIHIEALQLT